MHFKGVKSWFFSVNSLEILRRLVYRTFSPGKIDPRLKSWSYPITLSPHVHRIWPARHQPKLEARDRGIPLHLSNDPKGCFRCMNHRQSTHHSALLNQSSCITDTHSAHWVNDAIRKPHECVFWVEISRVVFLAGKSTRPQIEWVSQAKKTMSVISTQKTHEYHFLFITWQ
jgi:hypothetical protein